jgi:bifunctional non-homologous end joining protein LigD
MAHPVDPPAHIAPMLARAGALPADPAAWSFEIKWDGIRAISHVSGDGVRLESRSLLDITSTYPELTAVPAALRGHRASVLDGEIVAFAADGRPSFGLLQQRMNVGQPSERLCGAVPVSYVIYDLLYLDGEDLTGLAYRERRDRLAALEIADGPWQVPEIHPGQGAALLEATRRRGLEGVIGKRLDSLYRPGARNGQWLKFKHTLSQELVIGGWLPGEGRRTARIGALLMGHYEDARLRFDGRVGTGFSDRTLTELTERLTPLIRSANPFDPPPRLPANAMYVDPQLVAEIEFSERTREGLMRAPSFKGLRDDKPASEVRLEAPAPPRPGQAPQAGPGATHPGAADGAISFAGRTLKISNHAKVLYPETGFTKGAVIDYYARIAPAVLGHLHGRALTLKRYPNGVEGAFFYEKNSPAHRPDWVPTARVGDIDYTLAQEPATLVWLANLADIELHSSLSLAASPQSPTVLAFDLDPGPPAGVLDCAEVARVLRGLFAQLGMISAVKTSGAKGLQVYVPINDPAVNYAQTKPLARRIAELLEARLPELVISSMSRSRRAGRVFVDWSQNDAHKTTVTVYSLRATPVPGVSTPLSWTEMEAALEAHDAAALRFSPAAVLERIATHGDLFAPVLDTSQTLPALT